MKSRSKQSPSRFATDQFPRFIRELQEFVRIPTISSQPRHAKDVRNGAYWLADQLGRIGVHEVRIVETPGHPIVYAEHRHGDSRPTILIYGHYDVQPVDPLSDWRIPPFVPVVRDGVLYGRGASDDKGQLFCHLKASESLLKTQGALPLNVKFLFEGEEEIGSPNIGAFLSRNRRRLAADVAIISDTSIPAIDRPAVTYALRGGLALELKVTGPGRDLHSGHFGGAVHNPAQALAEILARMHRADGSIAIPGVYDGVLDLPSQERDHIRRHGPTDQEFLVNARVKKGWGESGYSLHERTTIRPALTINGLAGGHAGSGHKSIIPSSAVARISFRLVPRQTPDHVERKFRDWLADVAPSTVFVELKRLSATSPIVLDRSSAVFDAARRAYKVGFGATPVFVRSGGSIPIVHQLTRHLSIPVMLMGFGLPSDKVHAANERFGLENFRRGIETAIALQKFFGAQQALRQNAAFRPGRD